MTLITIIFIFIVLSVAEISFFGFPKEGKIKLPRHSALTKIPVIGKLYEKLEDYLSGLKFIAQADLKGLLIVLSYTLIFGAVRTGIVYLRKRQPEGWAGACVLLGLILIVMMLALAARYIYEGNEFWHELMPLAIAAIVAFFRSRQALYYGAILLHGLLAKLLTLIPVFTLVLVLLSMLVTFIVRAIKDNKKKKNPV